MAADTVVPDAYDGRSYNRYTYTDNRPLSFTDTTGHFPGAGVCSGLFCYGGDGVAMTDSVCVVICTGDFGFASIHLLVNAVSSTININSDGSQALVPNCMGDCEGLSESAQAARPIADARRTKETDAAQNADGAPSDAVGSSPEREIKYESTAMSDMDIAKQDLKTGSSDDMMDAIYPAMRAFHIDSTGVERYQVDPSFNDNSYTTPDGGQGIVTFGPPAFRSVGWLGASIAHEFEVHIQQQLLKGQWFDSKTDPQGYAMQEVQAYDHIISQQVSRFGLTGAEQHVMKATRDHFYIQLNAQNRALVDAGNYSTHYP